MGDFKFAQQLSLFRRIRALGLAIRHVARGGCYGGTDGQES